MASDGKKPADALRITFIVGGLSKGGAEKQFLYMLRVLQAMGAGLQVLTLTSGEFHERSLAELGIQPHYVGENPAARVRNILQAVRAFRPHVLQASHFFANLYAGLVGRMTGIPSIGAIRNDLYMDRQGLGRLAGMALRLPTVLLANSYNAEANARQAGIDPNRLFVLQNVIDLDGFDQQRQRSPEPALPGAPDRVRAVMVARLVGFKRVERFLQALAIARRQAPELEGLLIGYGPEENTLRAIASDLGLLSNSQTRQTGPLSMQRSATQAVPTGSLRGGVRFLGERHDIPEILGQSDIFVLTSDQEGFPNVLLEAMAAGLPVLATPAGETPQIIEEGRNGFLIPYDDIPVLAGYLVQLAHSTEERRSLGRVGRKMVEERYSFPTLRQALLETYQAIADGQNNRAFQAALAHITTASVDAPAIHNKPARYQKPADAKSAGRLPEINLREPGSLPGLDDQNESAKLRKG